MVGKILTKIFFCCRASSVSKVNSNRHPPPPIQKGLVSPLYATLYYGGQPAVIRMRKELFSLYVASSLVFRCE